MDLRWFLKKSLGLLPRKSAQPPAKAGFSRIAYLFAGTYGDFVQCLDVLRQLVRKYPGATVYLMAPVKYYRDFSFLLPENIVLKSPLQVCFLAAKPVDLLFTNTIGMYRVHFEILSYFCSRRSFGFCYGEESGRRTYSMCYRLKGDYKSYLNHNTALLGLPDSPSPEACLDFREDGRFSDRKIDSEFNSTVPDKKSVMFHLGSAGLKRDVGLDAYLGVIRSAVSFFKEKKIRLKIVAGAMDRDVIEGFTTEFPDLEVNTWSLEQLKKEIMEFEGYLVCFNSFMAHYCHYLNRRMIVLHNYRVPPGYDCGPFHLQVVLSESNNWDLSEFFAIFSD